MMTFQEWWKEAFERGTSGDMVISILEDWKMERERYLKPDEKGTVEETSRAIEYTMSARVDVKVADTVTAVDGY